MPVSLILTVKNDYTRIFTRETPILSSTIYNRFNTRWSSAVKVHSIGTGFAIGAKASESLLSWATHCTSKLSAAGKRRTTKSTVRNWPIYCEAETLPSPTPIPNLGEPPETCSGVELQCKDFDPIAAVHSLVIPRFNLSISFSQDCQNSIQVCHL